MSLMKILNNTHPRTAVYGANLQESSSLVENYWELFPEFEGLFFFFQTSSSSASAAFDQDFIS